MVRFLELTIETIVIKVPKIDILKSNKIHKDIKKIKYRTRLLLYESSELLDLSKI
ncbi:MAG TPA: hypothetical protein VIK86_04055 [Candidatus Paceibacterota bacterium]